MKRLIIERGRKVTDSGRLRAFNLTVRRYDVRHFLHHIIMTHAVFTYARSKDTNPIYCDFSKIQENCHSWVRLVPIVLLHGQMSGHVTLSCDWENSRLYDTRNSVCTKDNFYGKPECMVSSKMNMTGKHSR